MLRRTWLSVLALFALLASASELSAQTRVGSEFRVNTTIKGSQFRPSVSGLSDGGFIAVWHQHSNEVRGGFFQRFGRHGAPVGPQTTIGILEPHVAGLMGGGFVVVGVIKDGTGSYGEGTSIVGKRYSAQGTPVGDLFQISTTGATSHERYNARVSRLPGGGFVAVWQSRGQDGSGHGVYGQIFDGTNQQVGTEFLVNQRTGGHQQTPAVATLSTGDFVVTWVTGGPNFYPLIRAQRFNPNGGRIGSEWTVSREPGTVAVAALNNGSFVVVWPTENGIGGRRFDKMGKPLASEFQVANPKRNFRRLPSAHRLTNGDFVLTWTEDYQATDGHETTGIFGQRFRGSDGKPVGKVFRANTFVPSEPPGTDPLGDYSALSSSVAGLLDGLFVVVWPSYGQEGGANGGQWGVYGQRFR